MDRQSLQEDMHEKERRRDEPIEQFVAIDASHGNGQVSSSFWVRGRDEGLDQLAGALLPSQLEGLIGQSFKH